MITKTLAASAALALGLGAGLPAPADAQASPPTLVVAPSAVDPGAVVSVTSSCSWVQAISTNHLAWGGYLPTEDPSRFERRTVHLVEGPTGTWTGTFVVDDPIGDGYDDIQVEAFCQSRLSVATVDVEAPHLRLGTGSSSNGLPLPWLAWGADCPAGSTVAVVVTSGEDVVELTAPLDEQGDWEVELPVGEPGTTQTVTASCGDLTYDPVSRAIPSLPPTSTSTSTSTSTTTTTSSTTPPSAPGAGSASAPPPATPRPGVAAYTG